MSVLCYLQLVYVTQILLLVTVKMKLVFVNVWISILALTADSEYIIYIINPLSLGCKALGEKSNNQFGELSFHFHAGVARFESEPVNL